MTEAKLRRRISDCMFSAEPFHSSHFNPFCTRYALFLSQGRKGEFLGKLSSAQGCLQCQRIPRRRRKPCRFRAMQSSLTGALSGHGTCHYTRLLRIFKYVKKQMDIAPNCHTGLRNPKGVEGCDGVDKRATPKPLTFAMTCQQ